MPQGPNWLVIAGMLLLLLIVPCLAQLPANFAGKLGQGARILLKPARLRAVRSENMTTSRTNGALRPGLPSIGAVSAVRPLQGRCGMAASLVASAIAGLALAAGPAKAQSAQGLFWQCAPVSSTNPQPGYCPVSNNYPLPQGPAINALVPVAGTQTGVTISASTGMTIPAGATVALVQFQGTNNTAGQCGFWRDDGTAPTGTTGQASPAYTPIWIAATANFKAILATSATCTLTVSYYK